MVTRQNVGQLDEFKAIADRLRRPAADHPAAAVRAAAPTSGTSCTRPPAQQRELYDWLLAHGEDVLTGDSFFHLSAFGEALPGLNLCGAGRVVCLIDPVGDVYACPFAIHENFLAGNVRDAGRLPARCGSTSRAVRRAAQPADRRRLHDVRALRLLPRRLHGGEVLHRPAAGRPGPRVRAGLRRDGAGRRATPPAAPRPSLDHSHRTAPGPAARARAGGAVPVTIARRRPPAHDCDESPLAGLRCRA